MLPIKKTVGSASFAPDSPDMRTYDEAPVSTAKAQGLPDETCRRTFGLRGSVVEGLPGRASGAFLMPSRRLMLGTVDKYVS